MMRDENRARKCEKCLILLNKLAGVVQWQNGSFPSCIRGFDSLRPLQFKICLRIKQIWSFLGVVLRFYSEPPYTPRTTKRQKRLVRRPVDTVPVKEASAARPARDATMRS